METTLQPAHNDISLLVPDECWFSAPAERTPGFKSTFMKVSRALNHCLRDTLAPSLFTDLHRLANLDDGYPLLFYYSSSPCISKTEFGYDVLDEVAMDKFFRQTTPRFEEVIGEVWQKLKAEGHDKVERNYRPGRLDGIVAAIRTRERFRRRLNQILMNEARLTVELTRLGGLASAPPKVRIRECAQFVQGWDRILRRFYAGRGFTEAGPMLLRAATIALVTAQRRAASGPDDLWELRAA